MMKMVAAIMIMVMISRVVMRDKKRDQLCKIWRILTNKDCNHFIILWSRLFKYTKIQIEKYNST